MISALTRRAFAAIMFAALICGPAQAGGSVTVFAAASLKTALDEIAAGFTQMTGLRVVLAVGGSSALARQIQQGAPAQVFISANPVWMDVLAADGLLADGSRVNLVTNQLVLIAGPGGPQETPEGTVAEYLDQDRIAMALVDAVPAGLYGKAALEYLGIWSDVRTRVVQTDNVRAALVLVATGEVPVGIVYATDAITDPRVRVLHVFDPDTHPPIIYPAALLRDGRTEAADAFMKYLTGPNTARMFRAQGFGLIAGTH